MIVPVPPGVYDIEVKWGDKSEMVKGIRVSANQTVPVNIKFNASYEMEEVVIQEPAVKVDETVTGQVLSKEQIQQIATRDITVTASLAAGAVQTDEGKTPSFRGGRTYSTQYFIDGIRAIGAVQLPQKAIGQMQVISGIINITTGAPSIMHNFGAEIVSSQFTDPYNYNLVSFNGAGPIITKKDSLGNVEISRLGYFFDKLNNDQFGFRGVARFDLQLDKEGNSILKFGGQYFNYKSNNWSLTRSLLDYNYNPYSERKTYRGYVRYQQTIPGDTGSFFKNIFYTIQADYTFDDYWEGDGRFKDNYFQYGHIGKFTSKRAEVFELIMPDDQLLGITLLANCRFLRYCLLF